MSAGRGIALGGGGLGMLVVVLVVYLCVGGDITQLLQNVPTQQTQTQQQPRQGESAGVDENRDFVSAVLGSTEDVWDRVLPQQANRQYSRPKLVLFSDSVASACGFAKSATGPFYCPGDRKLYLDFSFFRELSTRFKAPGDFAQAYVIAHEVGHHIQNLLGTMAQVQRAGNSNELSVRLELQADCYAGVWAYYADQQGLVEAGDAEEAIRAAAAVGDDSIQKNTRGYVVPESFTHGSSRQRMEWFARGFKTGDMRRCDTFR